MTGPTVIEGRLEYLGWNRPWTIFADRGEADLAPHFWSVARRLRDAPATMPVAPESIALKADPASEYNCEWEEVGSGIILNKRGGLGFANIAAYVGTIFANLNGREVIASIEENAFHVFANPQAPEVPVLWRKRDPAGNSIPLDDEFVKATCKPGTADACLFLTASASGFECAKFAQSLTRMLLDRKAEGTIRARRIGDCRCAGWEGDQ